MIIDGLDDHHGLQQVADWNRGPAIMDQVTTPEIISTTTTTVKTFSPVRSGNTASGMATIQAQASLSNAQIAPQLNLNADNLLEISMNPSFATSATQLDNNYSSFNDNLAPTPEATPHLNHVDKIVEDVNSTDMHNTEMFKQFTEAEVAILDIEELRRQLLISQQVIDNLHKAAEDSRMQARHWALQHSMLEADFNNEKERFEVEKALASREVEVLRQYDSRRSNGNHDLLESSSQLDIDELIRENEKLNTRMKRAKRMILDERAQIVDLEDQIARLKKRIRENREHNNMADRAMVNAEASRIGGSMQQQQHPNNSQASLNTNIEDGLAALGEVASQVLAEQRDEHARGSHIHSAINSPLLTPAIVTQTPKPRRANHTHASTTISTPLYPAFSPNRNSSTLMSPLETLSTPSFAQSPAKNKRRRLSRDSTISASGDEEGTGSRITTTPKEVSKAKRQKKQIQSHTPLQMQPSPMQGIMSMTPNRPTIAPSPKKSTPRSRKTATTPRGTQTAATPRSRKSSGGGSALKHVSPQGLGVSMEGQEWLQDAHSFG